MTTEIKTVEEIDQTRAMMIGGCTWLVRYPERRKLRDAVTHLAGDPHGHHFVVTDEGMSIACSETAIDCLREGRMLP